MITNALLALIYYLLLIITSPLRLLSDVAINSTVSTNVTALVHYIAIFNTFLPMATLGIVVGLILTVELGLAAYRLIMWTLRRLPTQS